MQLYLSLPLGDGREQLFVIALCRVPFLPLLVSRQDLIEQEKQPCITQLRCFALLAPEVKLGVSIGHQSRAHLDFHL